MKKLPQIQSALSLSCLFLSALLFVQPAAFAGEDFTQFMKGGDMSYTWKNEGLGYTYYENGVPKDSYQSVANHGMNYVRLRLWSSDDAAWCGKNPTIAMAQRAVNNGMKVYLNMHLSDTWADATRQAIPSSWNIRPKNDYTNLKTKLYDYVYGIVNSMKQQNCTPSIVSLGNEEDDGILFPYGQISKGNLAQFAELVSIANNAVKAVDPTIKTIVHHSFGAGDINKVDTFFGSLINAGGAFDINGISHYRFWCGDLANLDNCLNTLANNYAKKILVCETSYPWTMSNFDEPYFSPNWWRDSSLLESGYPASAQGQHNFMVKMMDVIAKAPQSKGVGVFYWPTDTIAAGDWNEMENACYWDASHNLLGSIDAFQSEVLIGSGVVGGVPPPPPPPANLVTNPGFEADGVATQTPQGWTTSSIGHDDADYTESGGRSGTYRLTHFKANAYKVSTSQVITGLANGTYTLTAWVRSGGSQTEASMFAKNFGGADRILPVPKVGIWYQLTLSDINVTNGQCAIGFSSDARARLWMSIDDVQFFKN